MKASVEKASRSVIPDDEMNFNKATGAEFISASHAYKPTLIRNYQVTAAAGSFTSELEQTTPSGYKVYSAVQGIYFSTEAE